MNFKSTTLPNMNTNDSSLISTMVIRKFNILTSVQHARTQFLKSIRNKQSNKPPVPSRYVQPTRINNNNKTELKLLTNKKDTIQLTIDNKKEDIILPLINNTIETKQQSDLEELNNKKKLLDRSESLNDTITSNQSTIKDTTITPGLIINRNNRGKMNKIEVQTKENAGKPIENQETLNLLVKIKDSANAVSIGPMPLSLQACRFELPSDLKILETITPLKYLTNYCSLSSRRQYQFKRLFNKYRNRYHLFELSDLYLSILSIHKENFTRQQYNYLCQLIDLINNQEYEFKFDTYAGILALCERILYYSSKLYNDQTDLYSTKHAIEKCDFYSLDRKLAGLNISDAMKRLLYAL
ncbi:unnamed protein product [Rotaria sordida]|uniref:Uncharacterized protein n=1 Tax=Rotaria sordida TaxID=392033 RepID=A0A819ITH7_9BILA|nr:unnamed protein product [Rotaria sordida]CAF3922667.1 unnamed protein product [Rotaria sordida]